VIDFGVAKAVGRLQTTREGVIKGKLAYMPPEQISGQITTRLGDIYAAGVMLWEMLTGRRLFKADGDAELFGKVLAGPSDPPSRHASDLPAALDALTMRALARDAGARFATARDMADALVRLVPPALSNEVGAWVEDVAHEALSKRADQLAEIESRSSITVPQPASSAPTLAGGDSRAEPAAPDAEPPTTVSQPSRAAVTETRRVGRRPTTLDPRVRVALGSAAAALVGFGLWRAGAASVQGRGAETGPIRSSTAAATAPPTPSNPPAIAPSSVPPAPTVSADTRPPVRPTSPTASQGPPPRPSRPPPNPRCVPPYTLDPSGSGVRLPKPGCY
jgi:serine/threonine-protein kinase